MFAIDPQVFGTRLKNARKMAGMSLQQLSDAVTNQITKQSLSKYELGLMKPTAELIFAISKVLSVKPDYFLKQGILELGDISFRKRVALSKGNEELIVEQAKDYVERYLELESLLGIEQFFRNPLGEQEISDKSDLRKAAAQLRSVWEIGTGPISNLVQLLELKGIKIQLVKVSDDFDGLAAHSVNGIPIVVVNTFNRSIERIRFTILHELAHLLLNLPPEVMAQNKLIEEYCHYFSSCFLLPEKALFERIGGPKRSYISINELIEIKEQFGISIRAIVHRLQSLEVINSTYYQKWMVYMSKTYGSKNEPGSFKGEERQVQFDMLINRALSEGVISFSKAASLSNRSIEEIMEGYRSVK
ncbi:MAG: helix-turn-helix domain-containing protein [Imperialibacter sp.]|uniref:helix-turn-helix domain-containing protein n=1 Tax=Imperialibacter sp. TaxID=2038411 RepID=UPI003A8AF1AA